MTLPPFMRTYVCTVKFVVSLIHVNVLLLVESENNQVGVWAQSGWFTSTSYYISNLHFGGYFFEKIIFVGRGGRNTT